MLLSKLLKSELIVEFLKNAFPATNPVLLPNDYTPHHRLQGRVKRVAPLLRRSLLHISPFRRDIAKWLAELLSRPCTTSGWSSGNIWFASRPGLEGFETLPAEDGCSTLTEKQMRVLKHSTEENGLPLIDPKNIGSGCGTVDRIVAFSVKDQF